MRIYEKKENLPKLYNVLNARTSEYNVLLKNYWYQPFHDREEFQNSRRKQECSSNRNWLKNEVDKGNSQKRWSQFCGKLNMKDMMIRRENESGDKIFNDIRAYFQWRWRNMIIFNFKKSMGMLKNIFEQLKRWNEEMKWIE
jgi:hypothetical protein